MSQLAKKLPTPETLVAPRVRKGPTGECDVYASTDLEDWRSIFRLRKSPRGNWAAAQREVDEAMGITSPISPDAFRYHFNGRCFHWTPEEKHIIRSEVAAAEA